MKTQEASAPSQAAQWQVVTLVLQLKILTAASNTNPNTGIDQHDDHRHLPRLLRQQQRPALRPRVRSRMLVLPVPQQLQHKTRRLKVLGRVRRQR